MAPRAYLSKDTSGISDLVTHAGSDKFNAYELMKEALVAVFLANHIGVNENIKQAALDLHKWMRIIKFNCHEVVDPESRLVIGHALNPILALINHNCDSNYGKVRTPHSYAYVHICYA